MTYANALEYVLSLQNRGIKLDLQRVRQCLDALGSPDRTFDCILVAGTNGKGSTASQLASILSQGGRRVGLFSSPHLIDYRERIRVDGALIDAGMLAHCVERDRPVLERYQVTFFEAAVALALSCFREERVDLAVLEVGLGGRLDATNVTEPILSVITHIGRDHVHILGDDLAGIAREKAGILRPGVPAVVAAGGAAAGDAIEARARELATPLFRRGRTSWTRELSPWETGTAFRFGLRPARMLRADEVARRHEADHPLTLGQPIALRVAVPGWYSVANASLSALAALVLRARGMAVSDADIAHGLERWRWPGRMERPHPERPLYFDAAHNRESARVAASAIARIAGTRRVRLVCGMVAKKDHLGFFREMRRVVDEVWVSAPQNPRALPAEELAGFARQAGLAPRLCATLAQGLDEALADAADPHGPLVFLAGSLFSLEEGYHYLGMGPRQHLWDPA